LLTHSFRIGAIQKSQFIPDFNPSGGRGDQPEGDAVVPDQFPKDRDGRFSAARQDASA
jgi:hypothetical protein